MPAAIRYKGSLGYLTNRLGEFDFDSFELLGANPFSFLLLASPIDLCCELTSLLSIQRQQFFLSRG
tara:strand:- start:1012 stop:1209 length:198 start_codon:yes stop_codon:yes gene_type:complete